MVRLKERYLLVNIIYPDAAGKGKGKSAVPDFVAVNQPTTDTLTPGSLIRAIKAEVHALFGDYGSGTVERSLSGMCHDLIHNLTRLLTAFSILHEPIIGGNPAMGLLRG